jgi:DNA-binding protein Fis
VITKEAIQRGSYPIKQVLDTVCNQMEYNILSCILKQLKGNKRRAAQILGLDYKTLFNKTKRYGI